MIRAVIIFTRATRDNPAYASVVLTRRSYRVFMVITARLFWQCLFKVAEHHPVARISKRPALHNRSQRITRLGRQIRFCYFMRVRLTLQATISSTI